jgi:diketogulonate reductase-like aldo/keto reductase
VAIAWTLTQGDNVVPIPGTRHLHWLEENVAAADLQLTEEDLRDIEALPSATGEMRWDGIRFVPESASSDTAKKTGPART